MLGELENPFSLTRATLRTHDAHKQIPISVSMKEAMKLRQNRFELRIIFISILLIGVNSASCSDLIDYRLLPGSTFTLDGVSNPGGQPQDITGTFQWHYQYHSDSFQGEIFEITSLHFETGAYAINLNANNQDSFIVWNSSNVGLIAAILDVGSPAVRTEMSGGGTYSGPTISPTYLSYNNVQLYTLDDRGYYYGSLNLYAEQVPEPATFLFFALGGLIFRITRAALSRHQVQE